MLTHLGVWFFFGYVIHFFVVPLNKIVIPILGFPLGFYMAAQGSLIVFVVMLFVFASSRIESTVSTATPKKIEAGSGQWLLRQPVRPTPSISNSAGCMALIR